MEEAYMNIEGVYSSWFDEVLSMVVGNNIIIEYHYK